MQAGRESGEGQSNSGNATRRLYVCSQRKSSKAAAVYCDRVPLRLWAATSRPNKGKVSDMGNSERASESWSNIKS